MSLASQLDRYLAVRRSLGYDLRTSERVLRRFIRFADDAGARLVHALARQLYAALLAVELVVLDPQVQQPGGGALLG